MAAVLPQRDPCVEGKKTSPPPVRLMLIRARASLSHDKALISASSGWTRSACVRRVGRDLFCGLPSPLKIRTQRKREGMWRAGGACQRRNGRNSLSVDRTGARRLISRRAGGTGAERMASKGVTAADFGNTASSKKFSRTREEDGGSDAPALAGGSGATPAAAAFLAELRQEIKASVPSSSALPAAPAIVAQPPAPKLTDDNFFADIAPSTKKPKPKPAPAAAAASMPPQQKQVHKEFLSKAERKRLKKASTAQKQQKDCDSDAPQVSGKRRRDDEEEQEEAQQQSMILMRKGKQKKMKKRKGESQRA